MPSYEDDVRRRPDADLVLAPGEYAYIQDGTKGNISVYVGPQKTSLSQTDLPVNWDPKTRNYKRCEQAGAIHSFPSASEGFYMVLQNPVPNGKEDHPQSGKVSQHVDLAMGRKINIPGPATFPLWPGQSADVIEGHRLRSNQYLMVRVYNDDEARRNWDKAVVKPQNPEGAGQQGSEQNPAQPPATTDATVSAVSKPEKLTMGQLIVVRGTDVSFYIPPTGVEVVPDENENRQFVRNAVTLERLEYCILLDESGDKRYVQGPAVVFPRPTETFVEETANEGGKTRKFRAIELNEIQGLYVKVIADYKENDRDYRAGEELFVTGKDQAIYYPRPEHSLIRYGSQTKHYAVAIPAGEARYVIDRMAGNVELVRGPKMFLPDPRKQIIVRRPLSDRETKLWFPGNTRAIEVNATLRNAAPDQSILSAFQQGEDLTGERALTGRASTLSVSESFQRGSRFSEPRTITLDTKYEGSVRIEVWPGFAVLVVSKTGKRRVVVGPETTHLEYDETLLPLALSTGKPKTTDKLYETVYLKVKNNTVSDVVYAETKDLCGVTVTLSYRVNFVGQKPEKWFDVDNYVKFLTDHARSLLRHAIKQRGIEDFYQNAPSIIRDTILSVAPEGSKERPGLNFPENDMQVYDVEILDVTIDDEYISTKLVQTQQHSVETDLKMASLKKDSEFVSEAEELKREDADARAETAAHQHELDLAGVKRQLETDLEKILNAAKTKAEEIKAELERQAQLDEIDKAELARKKAAIDQEFEDFKRRLEANTEAIEKQVGAVDDKLADALVLLAHTNLAEEVTRDLAPLTMLGGGNVEEMFNKLVGGTLFQDLLERTRRPAKSIEK